MLEYTSYSSSIAFREGITSMRTAGTSRCTLLAFLLLSALALLLAGCTSPTSSTTSMARKSPPEQPVATAVPSPTVSAYLLPSAPLLPAGWSWYRDDTGHFRVPLAPEWGVGDFYGTIAGMHNCYYRVQFFPAGSVVAPSQASATFAPRLIEIDVNMSCPPSSWAITPDQYTVKEPAPVMVDGQPVTLWDNDVSGQIFHSGDATFYGHQFGFAVQSRDSNFIPQDLQVFLQMLHGFQYVNGEMS